MSEDRMFVVGGKFVKNGHPCPPDDSDHVRWLEPIRSYDPRELRKVVAVGNAHMREGAIVVVPKGPA
jgi:hypothetical protein